MEGLRGCPQNLPMEGVEDQAAILVCTFVLGVPSMLSLPVLSASYQVRYEHLDNRASHQMFLKANHFYLSNACL